MRNIKGSAVVSMRVLLAAWLCVASVVQAEPPEDNTPPTVPGNFTATPISGTQVNLSWSASFDQHQVTYYLYRCIGDSCVGLGTTGALTLTDTGASPATSYTYRNIAVDGAWGNLSDPAFANATTPDTLAPGAPSGLSAAAASGSRINLSWGAASDNVGVTGYRVERCSGSGCGNFVHVASVGGLTYADTGLAFMAAYAYRVLAVDAAGNVGPTSNTSAATTIDDQVPQPPSTVSATSISSAQINVSWSGASDNPGVTGYVLEVCAGAGCTFAQLATPTAASFSHTSLAANTLYTYRVRARDAQGNVSSYSVTAAATTWENQAPSAPGALTVTSTTTSQVNLSWTAATDNVGVTGYSVERCTGASCTSGFVEVGTPGGAATTFSNTGLPAATTYRYRVRARDAVGNWGAFSNLITGATKENQPPSQPTNLSGSATGTQVALTWTASTDNVAVTGYEIYRCTGAGCTTFALLTTSATNSYTNTGLAAGQTYRYKVRAYDAVPNYSAESSIYTALVSSGAAPTIPGNLRLSSKTATQIVIAWNASTDDVGVANYVVDRAQYSSCSNWQQISTPSALTFTNTTGITAGSTWCYRVRAKDASNNYSGYSNVLTVTTPPTVPTSLTATPGANKVTLGWTASSGPSGMSYLIERCVSGSCTFAQIGTATTNSYVDSTAVYGTTYQYKVRATDPAGNASGYSNTVTAAPTQPPDNAPTVPTNLTVIVGTNNIVVAWAPSTDDRGVDYYDVQRCTGNGTCTFSTIATVYHPTTSFTDTNVTFGTQYTYRVRAHDNGPNYSGFVTGSAVIAGECE